MRPEIEYHYMNLKTAIRYQSEFVTSIQNAHSMAESYGMDNEALCTELNRRVFSTSKWKRCPRNVKEYVNGYRAALVAGLYYPAKLIVWRHIWNGIAYDSWDTCPEECRQAMRENRGDSAHVWAKHLPAIKRFSTASQVA